MEDLVYDPAKVKDFFEHLILAYKKHERKGFAKQELDNHLEKVKKLAFDKKASKRKIEASFKQLESQIKNVISIEKEMLSKGDNKILNKELKGRIISLENKFDKYTDLIQGRRQRIKSLEKKIKQTTRRYERSGTKKSKTLRAIIIENKPYNSDLKNKLYDLEEKYYDLKIKGYPQESLKAIKDKINKIKQRL